MIEAGETAATITVFELPPSADWSSSVSTCERYGTNTFLPGLLAFSASAEMTLPRAESDTLISMPSCRRAPVAPVDSARSDPARSTSTMSLVISLVRPSSLISCVSEMVTMVCARDDVAFMSVAPTVRLAVPMSCTFSISSYELTAVFFSPCTYVPFLPLRIFSFSLPFGLSRSRSSRP